MAGVRQGLRGLRPEATGGVDEPTMLATQMSTARIGDDLTVDERSIVERCMPFSVTNGRTMTWCGSSWTPGDSTLVCIAYLR